MMPCQFMHYKSWRLLFIQFNLNYPVFMNKYCMVNKYGMFLRDPPPPKPQLHSVWLGICTSLHAAWQITSNLSNFSKDLYFGNITSYQLLQCNKTLRNLHSHSLWRRMDPKCVVLYETSPNCYRLPGFRYIISEVMWRVSLHRQLSNLNAHISNIKRPCHLKDIYSLVRNWIRQH